MTEQEAIRQVRILYHGKTLYRVINRPDYQAKDRDIDKAIDLIENGNIVYEDAILYLRQLADTLKEAIDYSSILAAFKRVLENYPINNLKTSDGLGAHYMAVGRLLQLLDHESLEFYERLDDERQGEVNKLLLTELIDQYGIDPDDIETMEFQLNIK